MLFGKIKSGLLSLLMILFFSGFAFGYDFQGTNFNYRKDITIDHTKIDADLSYFPVLVKLDSSKIDFNHFLQDNGNDIRFTDHIDVNGDADGNVLDFEIERFEKGNEVAEIWVEIPSIASGSDTTFYMFYGNAGCGPGENVNGTWDVGGSPTDKFDEVFHLHEISGTHYDSTSNNYTGIVQGTVTQNATGKINGADRLVGQLPTEKDSWIELQDGTLAADSSFTIEVWFQIKEFVSPEWYGLVTKGRDSVPDWLGLGVDDLNRITFYWYYDDPPGNVHGSALQKDQWYYAVATFDNVTENKAIYLDGGYDNGDTGPNSYGDITEKTRVGNDGADASANSFEGFIDEVRISKTPRSAAWIKASYHSGNDSLLTIPTLVELSCFRANGLDSAVLLEWATETELDNAGFNLWKSEERNGEYVRINPYFIPAEGESGFGAEYSFTDYDVTNGVIYNYKLEDIDINGNSTFHGPIPATPNDIIPIWPDEWEILPSGALLFNWASCGNYSYKIEISSNPSFPAAETLSFPAEEWTSANSLWLAPREWEMVLNKARESGAQLFWRVRAMSQYGRLVYSDWKRFIVENNRLPEE
jgi:hypothetical protein